MFDRPFVSLTSLCLGGGAELKHEWWAGFQEEILKHAIFVADQRWGDKAGLPERYSHCDNPAELAYAIRCEVIGNRMEFDGPDLQRIYQITIDLCHWMISVDPDSEVNF